MANARTVALVSGIALLGIAAFVFLIGESRRTGSVARGERVPDAPGRTDASDEHDLAAPVAPAEPEARATRTSAPEPGGRSAGPAPSADLPAFAVELVEARTGRALPGAEVWFEERVHDEPDDVGALEGFPSAARSTQADARGLARLPVTPGKYVQVVARTGELFGRAVFPVPEADGGERARLELLPDWDLEVEVLDASGRAAPEVPIRLAERSGNWSSSSSSRTDAAGRARLAHTGFRLAEAPERAWSVAVDLPLEAPLVHELDPAVRPASALVFRLPPLGAALVRVFEVDGAPAEDGTRVHVGIVRPDEPRDVSPFAAGGRKRASATTLAGTARFEFVELGGELEVLAGHDGQSATTREYFPGPQRAGERVECSVFLGLDHPVLVLRAVGVDGKPLAREELEIHAWTRLAWTSNREERNVRTDEAGIFRIDAQEGWAEGDVQKVIVWARAGAIGAVLDLGRSFERGLNVLPDLVLEPAPLLAEGMVVDGAGEPVEGARVALEVAGPLNPAGGPTYWEGLEGNHQTDAAGRFSARGFAIGEELRLTATHGSGRGEPVQVVAGARDVRLVLARTGEIAGRVLLDAGIPGHMVNVTLRLGGSDDDEVYWDDRNQTHPEEDGAFRITDQLPGSYTLEIGLDDQLLPLAKFDHVEVTAGEPSRDPRLASIDLRGLLFAYRFHLVPPEPDPELTGNLTIAPTGVEEGQRWSYVQGSPALVVSPHRSIDVTIAIGGYRTVFLEGVSGDREVELQRAIGVRLVLPAHVELPAPPYYLKAALASEGEDQHTAIDWGASAFDETRTSFCRVGGSGRMRVMWLLERRSGGGASATTIQLEPEQFFEVRDVEGQIFELEVSAEALAAVLAKPPF